MAIVAIAIQSRPLACDLGRNAESRIIPSRTRLTLPACGSYRSYSALFCAE